MHILPYNIEIETLGPALVPPLCWFHAPFIVISMNYILHLENIHLLYFDDKKLPHDIFNYIKVL